MSAQKSTKSSLKRISFHHAQAYWIFDQWISWNKWIPREERWSTCSVVLIFNKNVFIWKLFHYVLRIVADLWDVNVQCLWNDGLSRVRDGWSTSKLLGGHGKQWVCHHFQFWRVGVTSRTSIHAESGSPNCRLCFGEIFLVWSQSRMYVNEVLKMISSICAVC